MDEQTAAPASLNYHLVVVHPFGPHQRGTKIEDSAEVDKILAGEHVHHVRKVWPQ